MALRDNAAAKAAYAHAAQMSPGDVEVALGYARLLSREKRYAEAEAALQPARQAHPENRELQSELAAQEMLQGRTDDAIHLLEALHATAPADAPIARLLASAYVSSGTPDKANPLYAALLAAESERSRPAGGVGRLPHPAEALCRRRSRCCSMRLRSRVHFPIRRPGPMPTACWPLLRRPITIPETVLKALAMHGKR